MEQQEFLLAAKYRLIVKAEALHEVAIPPVRLTVPALTIKATLNYFQQIYDISLGSFIDRIISALPNACSVESHEECVPIFQFASRSPPPRATHTRIAAPKA